MTRINLIPASLLTDQHLLAENKEIPQLAGQFQKSLRSPNFNPNTLPKQFTLGTGHVRFFYRLGEFIRLRSEVVHYECLSRGFNVKTPDGTADKKDPWSALGRDWNWDYEPGADAIEISTRRIIEKILLKPDYYRYHGQKIEHKSYIDALLRNDPTYIKIKEGPKALPVINL